jgi:hypothetical protein
LLKIGNADDSAMSWGQRAAKVDQRELVGDLVERGAPVVDALPDQDAEVGGRVVGAGDAGDEPPLTVKISSNVVEVAFHEPGDSLVEFVQVILCPVELEDRPEQRF